MAFDFTNLSKLLPDTCNVCHIDYILHNHLCLFCRHFNPWRDTYTTIVKEIYWHYIKSGSEKKEYYISYLENLKKWCNIFRMPIYEREEVYILSEFTCNP